jgi:uncharacterized Zn-finger protein
VKIDDEPMIVLHCQFCTEEILELSTLIEHLKVHLKPLLNKDVNIHCAVEECHQRFDYNLISTNQKINKTCQLRHLEEHIRAKHTKTAIINCEECGKKFFSPMGLNYHRKQHMDKTKFYCYNCERFIHSNVYEKHVSKSNCVKSDSYRCTMCGKGFSAQSYLDSHMQIHSDQKAYQCTFCPKRFHQKGNLKTHQEKKHK